MAQMISLTIDGKKVEVPAGTTILEAAQQLGITLPTLCHHPDLTPVGSCRLCVVEVENMRTLPTACTLAVSEGMVVHTHVADSRAEPGTDKVVDLRRFILSMLLSDHPNECMTCEVDGDCELQRWVYEYNVAWPEHSGQRHARSKDSDPSPVVLVDMNKCILCGKCVRVCNEIQVHEVLDFSMRGSNAKVGPAFDADYIDSECVFCGACVDACPVGALTFKQARFQGRPWELEKVRTTCPYCGVGCQMDLNINDGKVVKVTTNRDYDKPNQGMLCSKGRFGMNFIDSPDRLKTPLIRRNGELKEASWEETYSYIAEKFASIKEKNGPDSIAGLSSARCTNEENYVFQKYFRAGVGTNNLDHCARL